MIATAAAIYQAKIEYQREMNPKHNQSYDEDYGLHDKIIIVLEGTKGTPYEVDVRIESELVATITPVDELGNHIGKSERVIVSELDWHSERPIANVAFRDADQDSESQNVVQYLGHTAEGFTLRFNGSEQEVIVRSPKEHELSRFMLKPEVKDFSKFCVSPMPGTLISCSKFLFLFIGLALCLNTNPHVSAVCRLK